MCDDMKEPFSLRKWLWSLVPVRRLQYEHQLNRVARLQALLKEINGAWAYRLTCVTQKHDEEIKLLQSMHAAELDAERLKAGRYREIYGFTEE